jgi:hypothetical protein
MEAFWFCFEDENFEASPFFRLLTSDTRSLLKVNILFFEQVIKRGETAVFLYLVQ